MSKKYIITLTSGHANTIKPEAGIGIGTYVSYIGTHRFSRWVSKKIGMEDK